MCLQKTGCGCADFGLELSWFAGHGLGWHHFDIGRWIGVRAGQRVRSRTTVKLLFGRLGLEKVYFDLMV